LKADSSQRVDGGRCSGGTQVDGLKYAHTQHVSDGVRRSTELAQRQLSHTHTHTHAPLIKGKGSPHSITKRRVPELIPVLGSQPANDKSKGRLPLLSARPAVIPVTLKKATTSFAAL